MLSLTAVERSCQSRLTCICQIAFYVDEEDVPEAQKTHESSTGTGSDPMDIEPEQPGKDVTVSETILSTRHTLDGSSLPRESAAPKTMYACQLRSVRRRIVNERVS